jgi:hypothetical protein
VFAALVESDTGSWEACGVHTWASGDWAGTLAGTHDLQETCSDHHPSAASRRCRARPASDRTHLGRRLPRADAGVATRRRSGP